ncbi:hypothetical protein HMPREF9194_01090 [Treponema maltophilum ATCC 51939]|uniref:Uncharacterized protein n=1 Tax=Treponema maltophilum ATCC 51939 TaxID=1125699 RepID=S3L1V3_TREMA|nr:hypothetical protein [Treponema maltophilum]EPF30769.1 hypothetical protein HMPREF9194_01090 [Treponema maltophilum ATCC 51939]
MKALLISESDEILNSYAAFFKKAGYDTVCYRWLLKAMDNLEEIEPRVVFIDGFGYPRHWKTLAQYIKTSFKNAPLVLLAADLSDEETKKADCLDVHCIRGSIEDEQTRRNILSLLHPEQEPEATAEPVEEIEEPEVPAADRIQTAEPVEFAEPSEEESANPEPTTAPSLNDGEPVSARAEELAECEAAPVQPEVEPAEQSAELIAATEPAEIAEPESFAPPPETDGQDTCAAEALPFFAATAEPEVPAEFAESIKTPGSAETVFEEPEPIDNEPFFKAVQPLPEQSAEPVEQFEKPAVQEEKSEAASLDERNGENEPEAASGDNEVFSFTFFHPRTKTAIYGSTVSFKPPLLYFKPDDSSVLHTLRFGQKSSGVINDKGLASDVSVQIQGFENDNIELCLLK